MKKIYVIVPMVLVLGVLQIWTYSNSRTSQLFGELIHRVDTNEMVVALTFDDGPTPEYTPVILDILAAYDVKATFFLTGDEITRNREQALKILSAGHVIGNHSYSHPRMIFMGPGEVAHQVDDTNAAIRSLGYEGEIYFRPPYGKKIYSLPKHLEREEITSITWDVEAERGDDIAGYALENTSPGSIILLHVMYRPRETSREAVPKIIEGLKAKGYSFKTIPELMEYRNK